MNEKIEVPTMQVPPLKKICMTIGQLPSSYIETMSYYEMLVWFVNYLRDDIIPVVNANGEATHELQELYVELQNYVNNYFDNLDLQEEINNTLNAMVEDGTLDTIVKNYLSLYDTYYFHTLFATPYYKNDNEYAGMQGGCVLPDGTIIQCIGKRNEFTGKILKYNQQGDILNSRDCDYGHCNGVTYCDETNTVFITSTQDETLGYYMIYEINPTTLEEISSQDLTDKEFPEKPYGIVYVPENKEFVFINYWFYKQDNKYIWKTDINFNVLESKLITADIRSTSNAGRFGDYIGINNIKDNTILLFNCSNLEFYKQSHINELVSDTWYITEVEWFDTRNDKIYLGFIPHSSTTPVNWGGGTKVIAYFDKTMNYEETGVQGSEFPPYQEVYYIDSNATFNPLRNGTSTAPFINIYEALNSSLRTKNVTGDVQIFFKTAYVDNCSPIFSMNKTYRIYKNYSGNLTSLSSFAIAESAKVFFDGYVQLQAGRLIDVYNWGDCHIQNRGELTTNSYIAVSDGSKIIVGSSGSSKTSFAINADGIDRTYLYGEFVNTRTELINISKITPLPETSSAPAIIINKFRNFATELSITNNAAQIPLLSNITFVKVRFRLPSNTGNIQREETLVYTMGQYQDYAYMYYDSNSAVQYFHITISATGGISFTSTGNISDVSQLRIRILTY